MTDVTGYTSTTASVQTVWLDERQYAIRHGVTPMAVSKWIRAGKLGPIGETFEKIGRHYRINPEKADVQLALNVRLSSKRTPLELESPQVPASPAKAGTDDDLKKHARSLQRAKTLDAEYAALLTKLDYEVKTGVYVLAEDVKRAASSRARAVRDAILNVPPRLAPILAAEANPEIVEQTLLTELETALEELAR